MNTILYIGIALLLIGFVGFIICEIKIAQLDRHLFRQKQLDESFNNGVYTNKRTYNDCQ